MRSDRLAVAPLLWVLVVSVAAAQEFAPPEHLVHDWSTRHVIFAGLTPENLAASVAVDPRAWHSWINHGRHRFEPRRNHGPVPVGRGRRHHERLATDWQMPITAAVGPRVFPAKFGFDVNAAPDCANDYVIFPTNNSDVPGASGLNVRISLVGSITCIPGRVPRASVRRQSRPRPNLRCSSRTIPRRRAVERPISRRCFHSTGRNSHSSKAMTDPGAITLPF